MKKRATRILALCLALAMTLALTACGKPADQSENSATNSTAADGKLFAEPTDLDIVMSSHVSWPYNEEWPIWDYIEEATGATLKIRAIPTTDLTTKLNLMMASLETLPDLLHVWNTATVNSYYSSGAFLPLNENTDKLPNFTKYWDNTDELTRNSLFLQRTSGDGNMYSAPAYGTHTVNNMRTWIYRKDIFEKHGLKVPTTADELYEVAKKLKELYPDSYPLCLRAGMTKFDEWGPAWEPYFSYMPYYDYDNHKWKLGTEEPVMKEMVEFFLKMRNEGLIPPDFLTIETKSWEELMSTDRGFITLDYIVRIDFFNKPNREVNPDYTLALMAPPKPSSAHASQSLMKANLDFYGYTVVNTGNHEREDNAFKFVDWFYTDDAINLVSWGKEGETWEMKDGRKQFILNGDEQPQNKYGLATYGTYQILDTAANEALYTEEQVAACREAMPYLMPYANPTNWLSFEPSVEQDAIQLRDEIISYISENVSKILLGQTSISEWDNIMAEIKNMGSEELLSYYEAAFHE